MSKRHHKNYSYTHVERTTPWKCYCKKSVYQIFNYFSVFPLFKKHNNCSEISSFKWNDQLKITKSGTFLFLSVVIILLNLNCSVTILTWGVSVEPLSSMITSSFPDSTDGTLTLIVVVPCSDGRLSVSLKLVGGVGTGAKRRYWNYFIIERHLQIQLLFDRQYQVLVIVFAHKKKNETRKNGKITVLVKGRLL